MEREDAPPQEVIRRATSNLEVVPEDAPLHTPRPGDHDPISPAVSPPTGDVATEWTHWPLQDASDGLNVDRSGTAALCRNFMADSCSNAKCPFKHDSTLKELLCKEFAQTSHCSKGSACLLLHVTCQSVDTYRRSIIVTERALASHGSQESILLTPTEMVGETTIMQTTIAELPIAQTPSAESQAITAKHDEYFTAFHARQRRILRVANSAVPQQRAEDRLPTPPPDQSTTGNIYKPADLPADKAARGQAQIFDAAKTDLFYTLTRRNDPSKPKTAVLNISTLHRMSLQALKQDIGSYVEYMFRTGRYCPQLGRLAPLHKLMTDYCQAVRNLDYMQECARLGYEHDPFLMKSSRAMDRAIMESTHLIPHHVLPAGILPEAIDGGEPRLQQLGRNEANREIQRQMMVRRMTMAAAGGLLLIAPMLIMTNVNGSVACQITTCVFIVVFAGLVTGFTNLGQNEVLATTAAYAAVLVVFVGTSLDRH